MTVFLRVCLLLITLALMMACAPNTRVLSNHDDSLDFSDYKTYGFSSPTEIENLDLSGSLELFFVAAIERQMLLKGLVESDRPDILINVAVDVEDVSRAPVNANNCPRYNDYYSQRVADSFGGKGRRTMCVYSEGSIKVDMVDAQLNRTIWEGDSRVRIDDKDRGVSLARSVEADVDIMFGGSPVRDGNRVSGTASTF